MTTDPITEALDRLELAGQELESAAAAIEELREHDRKAAYERIRPYAGLLIARVEENVLQVAAGAVSHLAEDGATTSRDYGRGYAQAIRDATAALDRVARTRWAERAR